jgi:hypothetical protein
MANNVENYITVEGNKAVEKHWDMLFTDYHETVERPSYHGDGTIKVREYLEIQKHPFLEGYDEDNWYDWGCENIGAKWAHLEDADEGHAYIVSAWSPVIPYCEKLYDYLIDFDEEVIVRCQYEDEFRNFIGVWQNTIYEEIESDELAEMFQTKYNVDMDADDFDWSDEHEESGCMYDELYDGIVYNWFEDAI